MERLTKLILAIVIIGLLFEIILGPGILFFAGVALLFLLWGVQGGMTEGNPYKRMHYSAIPDFVEAKDYMRKQDIEERDNANSYTTMLIFGIGVILMVIDILFLWGMGRL